MPILSEPMEMSIVKIETSKTEKRFSRDLLKMQRYAASNRKTASDSIPISALKRKHTNRLPQNNASFSGFRDNAPICAHRLRNKKIVENLVQYNPGRNSNSRGGMRAKWSGTNFRAILNAATGIITEMRANTSLIAKISVFQYRNTAAYSE